MIKKSEPHSRNDLKPSGKYIVVEIQKIKYNQAVIFQELFLTRCKINCFNKFTQYCSDRFIQLFDGGGYEPLFRPKE
jgi:hypothetical protein